MSLLPLRTANNISILRAQFDINDEEIIEAIFNIEKTGTTLNTHHFEALLNCIPSEEEAASLRAHKGPITDLVPIDQFVLTLISVPRLAEKLRAFIFLG